MIVTQRRPHRRPRDPELAAKLDACDREQAAFDVIKQETSDRIAAVTAVIDAASSGVIMVEIDEADENSMVHAIESLEAAQRR